MKRQSGFTLIELLVSLVLGLIIVGSTLAIYISTVKGSSDTVKAARLNHDLEMAMQIMINDIRRAGYWGGAVAGSNAMTNPFVRNTPANATSNILIPVSSCVLYTYDADGDGVVDGNEYYGFKLDGSTVRMRMSGSTTDSADCSDGSWNTGEIVDSNEVQITGLTFSFSAIAAAAGPPATPALPGTSRCFNIATQTAYAKPCANATAAELPSGNRAVETRQVNIVLTGRLVDDNTVVKTLTDTVKVRNDRIFTQP